MSTADMNDELPTELQPLLQLLEGEAKSWSEVGKSLGYIYVQVDGTYTEIISKLFDTAKRSYKKDGRWRVLLGAEAKLRLMHAIGTCRTLRHIEVIDLTGNELEALLRPLQSNPVLRAIYIWPPSAAEPTDAADEHVDRICEILGKILQTSRIFTTLNLYLQRLTTAGAYHLASGLRRNQKSALNFLYLRLGESAESTEPSAVKHIAEMVLFAPKLSELRLWDVSVLDDGGIDTLANALALSTSLKSLRLTNVGKGASALLVKALTGESSNDSITSLGLYGFMEGIGDCLPLLLSSNQSLKHLTWDQTNEGLSAQQWSSLGQSLSSGSSLEVFKIKVLWSSFRGKTTGGVEDLFGMAETNKACVGLYLNSVAGTSNAWNSTSEWKDEEAEELLSDVMKKPIFEIHLAIPAEDSDSTRTWAKLAKVLSSKDNAFSSLYFHTGPHLQEAQGKEMGNFFQALESSSSLRLLTVDGGAGEYWPGGWKKLVDCLHVNTSITHLRFINYDGLDDDVFKCFMRVLQVNLTLKRVRLTGTSWETDGKKALIEEALRRNAEQDSYFSVFRRHGLPFQPAKNGRLFLCGSPFAGKTRLRHTLTSSLSGISWLGDKTAALWRTKGIEVELLKNDQEMQIAIWDLAGQWIFRTLQDILFPRTNHTSIFLFMFSPYDKENCCIKENLDHSFKSELEEWLRFIASNTQVTGPILPKVLIVMSHMDKMKLPDASWAQSIVMELRAEYETILDIHSEKLYFVDARRKGQVAPLKDFIIEIFRKLLKEKTLLAPRVCSKISSELAKRTKNIKYRPVWSFQEFYSFCYKSLQGEVNESFKPETASGLEVFEAIASYLHDTGSVIVIRSLDKIIVDPNWLTNSFLGELITMGHNFHVQHSTVQKSKVVPLSSKTGFVSSSDLLSLLSSFLGKHPEFKELDKSFLEELLVHFDLCYKLDGGLVNARYYMPTIVCEDSALTVLDNGIGKSTRIEYLEWSSPPERGQEFVGFRVQCDNPRRMSMTVALYPRFQIHLRHKLMTEMNLTEEDVICSRNCMHLRMDGHEIFIERSDMAKSHIDVMVKCSKYKSRETAMRYIQEHIVNELHTFCASPKGCPGVALVVGVLQTKCVEELVPLKYRGEKQAILIQKLKVNVEDYIMKRLEETTVTTGSWSESSSSILNYEHSWPPIPQYLPSSSELAKKLLPHNEVESVTKKIVEKHEQQLKQVDEISKEMDQDQARPTQKMVTDRGTPSIARVVTDTSAKTSSGSYTMQPTIRRVLSGVNRLQQKMDQRFHGLEQKMDERFNNLEATLGRIERNMSQIITLQLQLQSSMSSFMSKVDRMIGYAESKEGSRTPKRPYLSFKNISMFHKVTARVRLGTPVRLHLMCESIAGPHTVKDQPGLDLCLEKGNMEWLRCIYHVSFKMLYYLGKAALDVTLGLGDAVPDSGSVGVALPVSVASDAVKDIKTDKMVSLERSGNMTITEAWSHLRSSLAPHLNNRQAELFKLYRVKYLEEGGYAWVCDQCMSRGIRNRSLQCL